MAGVDSRADWEGAKEDRDPDLATPPSSGSHVKYKIEEDDETRSGPTLLQKVNQKASEYGDYLKKKESFDPHPELSYIPPGDGKGDSAVADLQEGKQHGGLPTAVLGNDVPAHVAKNYSSSVKDTKPASGPKERYPGDGADEPTVVERIKEKFWDAENHLKGKESSAVEDPHPELAYIPPKPEEKKEGFVSRLERKFGGDDKAAAEVPKAIGSSEVGTGYEEDSEGSETPAAVPKNDGAKPKP